MDRDLIAIQIAMQLGLLTPDQAKTVTAESQKVPGATPTLPPEFGAPAPGGPLLAVLAAPSTGSAQTAPPSRRGSATPSSGTGASASSPSSRPSGTDDTGVITQRLLAELRLLADRVIEEGNGDPVRASQLLKSDPALLKRLAAEVVTCQGAEELATVVQITECTEELLAGDLSVTSEQEGRYVTPGSFEVELGRGGIGRVLLVRDKHLGRDIAMKELLRHRRSGSGSLTAAKDALIRFLREARITGQLEHPNIVPVHEVGRRPDGTLYYTMKLVRGRTFSEVLAECRTLDDRLKLLPRYLDLCQAIAYAHSRGVIHRDIKPQNVMLGEFGETLVLDWGLAKVAGQTEALPDDEGKKLEAPVTGVDTGTVMGTTMGTPAYMSPEQASGAVNELDARSDVWALGAVLYELLSGRLPFGGGSLQSILHKVVTQNAVPVRTLDPAIPPDLASVCEKALQRSRDDRYSSAGELAREIESYLAGRRVSAHEYSSWQLVKRLVSRNKVASSLAGTILAVLIVASFVIFGAYREAEVSRAQAVTKKIEADRQRMIAVESRDAEQLARELAQKRETEANLNLSLALQEEAVRLANSRELLSAGIFASAALLYTPSNPLSPHRPRLLSALPDLDANDQLASLQSLLFVVATESIASLERTLAGHGDTASQVAFLSSGSTLLSASYDGNLRWWHPADGSLVRTIKAHEGLVQGLAVSADGTVVATSGTDNTIALWDAASGSILRRSPRLTESQRSLTFARDGRTLVSGGRTGVLSFWRLPGLELDGSVPVERGEIRSVEWLSERDAVIVAGTDKEIWLVSAAPPYPVLESLPGHSDITYYAALSPDRKKLVSASHDGTVRIWKLAHPESPVTLVGHKGHVVFSIFSPDGTLVASASHDRRVRLWDVETGTPIMTLDAHASAPRALAFSPDGTVLASAGEDRTVRLWKIAPAAARTLHATEGKAVYRVEFSPDGRTLVTASLDGVVRLWDIRTGAQVASLSTGGRMVWDAAFSRDGRMLYVADNEGTLTAFETAGGRQAWSTAQTKGRLHSVRPLLDGRSLAVAGEGVLRIVDSASGNPLRDIDGPGHYFWCADVSPDGSLLATADQQNCVVLWNLSDGRPLKELNGHSDWVTWVEFSADGKLLLSAGKDATIRTWEVATGRTLVSLTGHGAWVNIARLSPDGRHVLSGSDDNTVRLWDAATGRLLQSHRLDREESGAAFSPDGSLFAFADGLDARLYPLRFDLWRTPPDELLRKAQEAQGKRLSGFELLPLD